MQKPNFIPVILSGGSGSRLWPLSRALRPKQFLGLTDERTLFQLTLERLKSVVLPLEPIVIANDDHRFLVAEQCKELGVSPLSLILEPVARNTAPAIAVAAIAARKQHAEGCDPVLLVLPSDHIVQNRVAFEQAIAAGLAAAEAGAMVTFGIVPTSPETGY
ncbi:MAG: sugar phosphate nucleotidyltransferase, partial [Burkholderiaceae bacterium]